MNPQLISMLKRHEGFKSSPYICPGGHITVGYGHNCDAHLDIESFDGRVIDQVEAEALLIDDVLEAERDCKNLIRSFNSLDEVRQSVLIDMVFNIGVGKLLTFKNMLREFNLGNWKGVARQMYHSQWASQVGLRSNELMFMILTGEWL